MSFAIDNAMFQLLTLQFSYGDYQLLQISVVSLVSK